MKEGKPSATAELGAAVRAAEWLAPQDERVCHDPFAKHFLGIRFRIIAKSRLLIQIAIWYTERRVPGMFGYLAGRAGYVDDYLEACLDDGIEQLVILGAGYDSRAYRFDELKGRVNVYEVDHPNTQKVKMEQVKKIFGSLPDHVVYVPIDFENETLDERLLASGYNKNLKTLFIWEGVTYYLTPETVDATLDFVANNSCEGSSIIFDYVLQSALDGTCELEKIHRIRRILERIVERPMSEPFVFGIEEGTTEEFLSEMGFCQVTNVSGESFQSAWCKGTDQNRKVLCVVHATVGP